MSWAFYVDWVSLSPTVLRSHALLLFQYMPFSHANSWQPIYSMIELGIEHTDRDRDNILFTEPSFAHHSTLNSSW